MKTNWNFERCEICHRIVAVCRFEFEADHWEGYYLLDTVSDSFGWRHRALVLGGCSPTSLHVCGLEFTFRAFSFV